MPDTSPRRGGLGDPEDATEDDVDVRALSPWPRLRGRPRRITYRQVLARSWAVLGVAYVLLALWLVLEPYRTVREPFEKQLVPLLLVVMPMLAILAAALTALVLSTVWWCCWASWNPHVSALPGPSAAADLDDQPCPAPGGHTDADARAQPR
jgi:hypothetical protein